MKENLFQQLNKSEYFLFIDFKRERLDHQDLHRGSLFSHQELAVASFLDINVLAFQEQGVKQNDGILGFIQGNAIAFSDREKLPEQVAARVQQLLQAGTWDARWRNELVLERESTYFSDALRVPQHKMGRFFHIGVRNLHHSRAAMNCCAYLERAISLNSDEELPVRTVELKWEGYVLPNAHVHPATVRRFDAFWIWHHLPTDLQFNAFSDSSYFFPRIVSAGRYELTYSVMADNFSAVRRSFILDLGNTLDATSLVLK